MRTFALRLVQRYPLWVVVAVAAVTAIFGYGMSQVTITSELTNFFSDQDPRVVLFNETAETFGSSDYIMAAVRTADVFSVEGLRSLDDLTQRLIAVDGVKSVRSLTNVEDVRGSEWGIEVGALMRELPVDEDGVEAFRQQVRTGKQLASKLVSDDGRYALILLQLERSASADSTVRLVREAVAEAAGDLEVYLTGSPVLTQVMNEALGLDLLRLTPLVLLLILGILFASFRNWQGVLLPLVTVLISTVWSLGLMGFLRVPLTQLSAILPAVFTSVGSAYGIHVLHRYRGELRQTAAPDVAVEHTVMHVGPAVFMAGATTAAGFLSNSFSSVVRIREFGFFTAFGVAVAILVSLLVIPALLQLTGRRGQATKGWSAHSGEGYSARLERLGDLIVHRPRAVVLVAVVLLVLAVSGLPRLETDTSFVGFFQRKSPTRIAFDIVQENFGGVDTVQVVVEGDITEPAVLRAMELAQERLVENPLLSEPISVVDVVKRVSRVMHADDEAYEVVPDTRAAVAQYLLLLSLSGDETLSQLLTFDHEQAKIEVMIANSTSAERHEVLAYVQSVCDQLAEVPGVRRVSVTGLPLLGQAMADLITVGQVQSLALSLVTVFLLVWPIVGSAWGSLLCLVPIIITIVINFGVMGWAGLTFNVVTALVTSVAVGMGIDYSIHLYTRSREGLSMGLSLTKAVKEAMATSGYAVVLNAAAVASGFLVLLLSAFQPMRVFGALIAATMVVSSVSAITVLPALLLMLHREETAEELAAETGGVG